MANVLYPKYREARLQGGASLTGTVKTALVDLGAYTYSAAHQYYSSVQAAVVGTPVTLANKTFTNGAFDADDVSFLAVTGPTVEATVLYIDTGNPATSPLVAFIDTVQSGLPVTPNGGAINITWNAAGIWS